jgi:hypothetical protein
MGHIYHINEPFLCGEPQTSERVARSLLIDQNILMDCLFDNPAARILLICGG